METAYWLAISRWPNVGPRRAYNLLCQLGSGEAAWHADISTLQEIDGFGAETISAIIAERQKQDPVAMLDQLKRVGAWVLSLVDDDYPPALLQLFDPPTVILGWGQSLSEHSHHLAVIGSRRMTNYGRRITDQLIAGLAATDTVIVSGLALGIDGEAHRAALANGLVTWAVLGSGFANLYPKQHRNLALEIVAKGGTLLSEYWPDAQPETYHFPARNRIIAALSEAVLVVEADQKSGSLITVDHALDLGRDIWAVPGNITSRFSRGTNNLLRHGATLITSSDDILAEWKWGAVEAERQEETPPSLRETARRVFEILDEQSSSLESIVELSRLETAEVLAALIELELAGLVEAVAAQSYRRAGNIPTGNERID